MTTNDTKKACVHHEKTQWTVLFARQLGRWSHMTWCWGPAGARYQPWHTTKTPKNSTVGGLNPSEKILVTWDDYPQHMEKHTYDFDFHCIHSFLWRRSSHIRYKSCLSVLAARPEWSMNLKAVLLEPSTTIHFDVSFSLVRHLDLYQWWNAKQQNSRAKSGTNCLANLTLIESG